MRKICVIIIFAIVVSLFSVNAFAEESIALSAEISEIENGKVTVSVFGESVEKLVSLSVVVKYDAEVFLYENGYASSYFDEDGNEIYNFQGMWSFGELANGEGCVGAFVSYEGASKSDKTPVCEFVLAVRGKIASSTDITICVRELVTEDYNYENDIYEEAIINKKSVSIDYETLFSYDITGNSATITECFYNSDVVYFPEKIGGANVCSVDFSSPLNCSFVILSESVTEFSDEAFNDNAVLICPENSAAHNWATERGFSAFLYKNISFLTEAGIFVTENPMVDDEGFLFSGNAEKIFTPSHNPFYGTGSKIEVLNGEKSLCFLLSVLGDANGDSVSDALDVVFCEKTVSGILNPKDYEAMSMDLDFNENISREDYALIVNKALQ